MVKFKKCKQTQYNNLKVKDNDTLYFIEDTNVIYKGETLYSNTEFIDKLPEQPLSNHIYITPDGLFHKYDESEWIILNEYKTKLSDDEICNYPVTGEAIKQYINSQLNDSSVQVDAKNVNYDNSKFNYIKSTNVQDVLDEISEITEHIRLSLAKSIGNNDDDTLKDMANELITLKATFATNLREKGLVSASSTDSLKILINRIKEITNMNIIKNTKLNVRRGDTKEIKFNKPVSLDQLCLSLIKYIPGEEGKVFYTCHFDNSDKINFEKNDTIEFSEGTMSQVIKTQNIKCKDISTQLECKNSKVYEAEIDRDLFYKISSIDVDESKDSMSLNITGTNKPTVISGKNNVDLTNVYEISKMDWKTNVGNDNKLLALFTFDDGKTYKSFYNDSLVTVDIKNLQEVSQKGMNQTTVNSLTNLQWEELRQASRILKIVYYFEVNNAEQKCENNDLTMSVDMKGTSEIPNDTEFKYELSEDGTSVIISFLNDGTYTLIWVDQNIEK